LRVVAQFIEPYRCLAGLRTFVSALYDTVARTFLDEIGVFLLQVEETLINAYRR
jgi:hypothetical protein